MQSPKFAHKVGHLRKITAGNVLAKLWIDGVRDRMRKQLVPDAVEFLDFHLQAKQRCNELESLICGGNYIPRPVLRLKVEKSRGLCRQVALPSPEEALVLQALSNSLWKDIAPKAPSNTAFFAPQDQPFAKRNPAGEDDEWGYGPIESWLDFQREILRFSQNRQYIVVTDLANYYDSILHSFLRSILSDYGLEREYALDLLLYILDSMLWRPDYMPNYGIGLPQMDLDAPRLLAHTHLFEIDQLFASDPTIDFARYMDDMDFGVDSIAKAKEVLRDLDTALLTRNIRVNSGKTYQRPALRGLLLLCWSAGPSPSKQLNILSGFLASGEAIDDLSGILIATSLCGALHNAAITYAALRVLLFGLQRDDAFHVFARLWIVSRVETPSRLWDEIKKTRDEWSRHRFLGRLVAGQYGLLIATPHFDDFKQIVRRWGGAEAISVLEFHENLHMKSSGYLAARKFLIAPNPSVPVGIAHAKALMVATALWNESIPKLDRAKILASHKKAMNDVYYQKLFSGIISKAP